MVVIYNEVLLKQSLRFDVLPTEGLIGSGSERFIRSCVRELGVQSPPASWTVERFCSPFFKSHQDEWRDRIPSAWHVTVDFDAPPTADYFRIGRHALSLDVRDQTAPWDPVSELDWNGLPCIVIALFPLGNWENMVTLPDGPRAAINGALRVERLRFKGLFEQGRFYLGNLALPEAEGTVSALTEALQMAGAATNHMSQIPRSRIAKP